MKIANIIYEKKLVNHKKLDFINYYEGETDYSLIDTSLPTLIVGWNFMKSHNLNNDYIQNANVLSKRIISKLLYWEFSYEENEKSYTTGIESFINNIPTFYFSPKYSYINLDPVAFQIGTIDDLFDALPKQYDRYYCYKNEMIYLLKDNRIIGLNIDTYVLFDFDINGIKERLFERLKDKKENSIIVDTYGKIHNTHKRNFPKFKDLKKYLVILSK